MPKALLKNGNRIHYLQVGHGPDLVMIHGLSGNLAVWHLKMVPDLQDRFRVLTYDLRGHGYSDAPPTGYTTGDHAEDLAELLDALQVPSAALVGHSVGADVALNFALRYPERVTRIVAIEAALAAFIHAGKREEWEGWAFWGRTLELMGVTTPPEKWSDLDYMLRASLNTLKQFGPATGLARNREPLLRLLSTTAVRDYEVAGDLTLENVARIQTPVRLIYGEESAFVSSYRYLMTHLPNVSGTLLPPTALGGHFGVLEQPELLTREIRSYLTDGT